MSVSHAFQVRELQESNHHEVGARGVPPAFAEVPAEVLSILRKGGLFGLGESYVRGEWQCDDLVGVMYRLVTADPALGISFSKWDPSFAAYIVKDLLMNSQIGRGAYEVAKRHYDLGNDLFAQMLDRSTMTYTCGYWKDAADLEQAQVKKIDLLCRKLQLQPGMRVLDIGCGWGNFAAYAATHYGVSVVGLTVSKEQAALARERCRGIDVEVVLEDYRNYTGQFDRIVSIEMIEAVGRKNIPGYFEMVRRCLRKGGLFGLQSITATTFTRTSAVPLDQYVLWLRKRIFPNGYLSNHRQIVDPIEHGLVVEDLHNFSADYALTLQAWRSNFLAGWERLQARYGDEFKRIWLYYLCGCEALFRARMVQLYQVVYSHGGVPGGYQACR
jgi:cyclopropane-fatty-acyl-phospholipid synthase